jgi:hypothetical protein
MVTYRQIAMRSNMLRSSQVAWFFLLVAPVALAQPTAGGASDSAPVPPGAAPAGAPPIQPEQQQKLSLTGPQMLAQGREYRKEIQSIQVEIKAHTEQAKADKDVIRLNCLLDKLMKVDANAQTMDQTLLTLQEMITKRDENGQLHAYTRVTIINELVKVLKTEADACVGAETNYVGPTQVVVDKPPLPENVDQAPGTALPPFSVIDRPVPASPSM